MKTALDLQQVLGMRFEFLEKKSEGVGVLVLRLDLCDKFVHVELGVYLNQLDLEQLITLGASHRRAVTT